MQELYLFQKMDALNFLKDLDWVDVRIHLVGRRRVVHGGSAAKLMSLDGFARLKELLALCCFFAISRPTICVPPSCAAMGFGALFSYASLALERKRLKWH
jgi:hypothetical protein